MDNLFYTPVHILSLNTPVLLIDADILIHRILHISKSNNKDLEECKDTFENIIYRTCQTIGCSYYRMYTSSKKSFRKEKHPVYKSNRKTTLNLEHLAEMFDYVSSNQNSYQYEGLEADDCIAIDANILRKLHLDYLICSYDSDLYQIPGYHYNPFTKEIPFVNVSVTQSINNFIKQVSLNRSKDSLKGIGNFGESKLLVLLTNKDIIRSNTNDYYKNLINKVKELYIEKNPETGLDYFNMQYELVRLVREVPDGYYTITDFINDK